MTNEDIIRMALEAGGCKRYQPFAGERRHGKSWQVELIAEHIEQRVAHEREACAKVAESFDPNMRWSNYGLHIANAIRARVTARAAEQAAQAEILEQIKQEQPR